jgi:AcrR family transcriptional regulator
MAAGARQRILDATQRLLDRQGGRPLTTRAIARAAGCSDSALYKHFPSLDALLLEVFKLKLPSFALLSQLALRVGEHAVEDNLAEVLVAGLGFIRSAFPVWMALATNPRLRKAYFRRLGDEGRGPQRAIEGFAAYLRAEQRVGRVRVDADPLTVAQLLLSSLVSQVFVEQMMGANAPSIDERKWSRRVVSAVIRGIC